MGRSPSSYNITMLFIWKAEDCATFYWLRLRRIWQSAKIAFAKHCDRWTVDDNYLKPFQCCKGS